MKNTELNVSQRIVAIILYISSFLFLCYYLNNDSWDFINNSSNEYNLLFVSGALLLVFGSYLTDPYFTKPVDIITNATAIILALLSVNNTESFIGYSYLLVTAYLLLGISILVIFLYKLSVFEKVQYFFYLIITKVGQSRIAFSAIYLATLFSYFNNKPVDFAFLFTFWIVFITGFIVESFLIWFSKIITYNQNHDDVLGLAIGCENPFSYKVEVDFQNHKASRIKKGELVYLTLDKNRGALGIVINEKQLLNKKWLTIYLLEDNNDLLKINLKTHSLFTEENTIFSTDNAVYTFDINYLENSSERKILEENYLYRNKDNFIGYITSGSDINKICFHSLIDSKNKNYLLVREGAVIKTEIHEQETLFQIIDGKTTEEQLEKHNVYGYLIGIAQKLGKYNSSIQELETIEWIPNIFSPVFFR